ncbi:MAG: hypothetical protein ACXWU1_09060 [Allosphingosinicella sp.]
MSFGPEPPYVALAGAHLWSVERSRGLRAELRRLGFRRFPFSATARLSSRNGLAPVEMARLASQLRDFGIAFSFGRDWSPSEMVQQLRADGLLQGSFNEISWTRQGWQVRTV